MLNKQGQQGKKPALTAAHTHIHTHTHTHTRTYINIQKVNT